MRLVDTSAIIEWLVGSATGQAVEPMLPEPDQWLAPTIVQLELSKWMSRELDDEKTDRILAFIETCIVVPLDTTLALSAARLCAAHKLATADAIVYATAQAFSAELLTCDAHFEGLPDVVYVPKGLS